ncbi:MAG: ABC transporter ATP-binding protein [Candidatus Dormibacteria bacterium]
MSMWQAMVVDTDRLQSGQVQVGVLRRAWVFVRPLRWRLVVFLLLLCLSTALGALPPLLFRGIIDAGIGGHDLATIDRLGAAAALIFVVSALLLFLSRWLGLQLGNGVVVNLRMALFDHVQRMPIDFFTRVQTGRLQSRLNNDVQTANGLFTDTLSSIVTDVLSLVVTLAMMAALSWQLTVAVVILAPVMLLPSEVVGRRTRVLYKTLMQQSGELNTVMSERFNVAGALLVKLFGHFPTELENFGATTRRIRHTGVRIGLMIGGFIAGLTLVGSLAAVLVYWLGARAVLGGGLTLGTLVALAAYVQRVYAPMLDLASARVNLVNGLVSFQRVFEVLDAPRPIVDRPDAAALVVPRGRVEFHEVWFRYPPARDYSVASLEPEDDLIDRDAPSDWILRGISFVAEPGTMTAVVGPSGSGKSTLCSLIPRLHDPTNGSVTVDGHDVRDLTLESLTASIGLVAQDPFLFHDTVAANLRYAKPGASDAELVDACRAARVHDLIAALPQGYDTVVGERGFRFSGGEKQRLAIARVLLKDPAMIILDEATSSLDSETEALVQEALAAAMTGRTSFVIAHRLSTIRAADQIVVLTGGTVVEMGSHDDLAGGDGVYAGLHATQMSTS